MERASDTYSTRPIYESKSAKVRLYLFCKRLLFYLCKGIGLFHIARRMHRNGLRILCYHGFSLIDESRFSPRTFIEPRTFEERMRFLTSKGFHILNLGEALEALETETLPWDAVVITIDDGFYSTYRAALQILKDLRISATVYVTTYYAVKESPIFRLAVQYMFWKTTTRSLEPEGLGLDQMESIPIATAEEKRKTLLAIIRFAESHCNDREREALANVLGERLGVPYRPIKESRIFSIINPNEIAELACNGIDIELHTHRHNLPLDRAGTCREIEQNRAILEPITNSRLEHFCYPSGFYRIEQLPWLSDCGILSAVTGESGLNYRSTPWLRLKRFVDGEDVSQIEFEGEMTGFAEMLRRMVNGLKGIIGGASEQKID